MRTLHDFAHADRPATRLLIMLPGALQQPEQFEQAGFSEALRTRGLPIDLALVDLGIEYIGDTANDAVLDRVHTELIQPARLQRYAEIWLGGISIGGLTAIAYADRYPGQIEGLCLLSPYPGNRILTREIKAAGGLDRWLTGLASESDAEHRMWRWLHARNANIHMHLGYGLQDRFAPELRLMAEALAASDIDTIPGGHDWPTWAKLWENFLDQKMTRLKAAS